MLLWSLIAIALLAAALILFARLIRSRRSKPELDSRRLDVAVGSREFEIVEHGTSGPAPPNPPETAPPPIDKNVQFTVYRPATVVPEKWYPLLAFAHLSERRADAPPQEPDPIQQVEQQAARILSEQPAKYEQAKLDRAFSVPRKGALTFVPSIEGCEFNPPSQSILWQKDVHKVEFEMKASNAVDGRAVEGQMTIYLGPLILAEVALRIHVDSRYSLASEQAVAERADAYRKIFASYSHRDEQIVEEFENMIESLGDQYLIDVKTLRSGEVWSEQLKQMIRDADIFQLFWSSNSMISQFVREEWEYALSLNRSNFIRPVYWEKKFPEKKPDLPPETLRRLHFYRLPSEEEEEQRSALIPPRPADQDESSEGVTPVNVEPVPKPVPIKLARRFPIKALTTVALGVLLVAVLVPVATIYRVGTQVNTNANTSNASPAPTLQVTALNVKVDPIRDLGSTVQGAEAGRYRGQSGSYELIVKNLGPGPMTDVIILEELPPALAFVLSTPLPLGDLNKRQQVEWRESQIPENGEIRIRISIMLMRNLNAEEELTTKQTITFTDARGNRQTIHSTQTALPRLD